MDENNEKEYVQDENINYDEYYDNDLAIRSTLIVP
jgi:hypothetical protein